MSILLRFIVMAVFSTVICSAHADVIIKIEKEGVLVGLPEIYQPSSLKIVFNPTSSKMRSIESLTLTLGHSTVVLPSCLLERLKSCRIEDLFIHASWYHKEELLPHYLVIEFRDPGFDPNESGNPGFELLFNLHTGKLFSIGRTVVNRAERSWQTRPISLTECCSQSGLSAFYEPWVAKRPTR